MLYIIVYMLDIGGDVFPHVYSIKRSLEAAEEVLAKIPEAERLKRKYRIVRGLADSNQPT